MTRWRRNLHSWLRWSEQYTKTDMVYLAKGGFWLTASQGVASISSFVLAICFANLLPAETYGVYRYVLSITGVLAITTFPGLNTAAVRGVAAGEEASFWLLLKRKFYYSLLATIVCAGVATYYYTMGNLTLATVVLICSVGIPLTATTGMYESYLNGKKDFRRLAYGASAVRVATTLGLIVAIYLTDNLLAIITAYFLPEIIIQSGFIYWLYQQTPRTNTGTETGHLTQYGVHLSMMEVLKTIASQIDKLLIFHYLGGAELAVYTIATAAPSQIKSLLQTMSIMALPKLSDRSEWEIRQTLPQKLFRLEIVILGAIVAYWVAAPWLFPIVFPQYIDAVIFSQVYALSLIFFPRTFLSTAMTAQMKQNELYAIRVGAPLVRIVIFFLLLPPLGLWGAIIGSILGNALTALIYQHYFKKAFPLVSST